MAKKETKTLTKVGAKTRIDFVTQKEDDWFIDINHVDPKSGQTVRSSMIIRKDMDSFINQYINLGWSLV
jgi:hypothetical protein